MSSTAKNSKRKGSKKGRLPEVEDMVKSRVPVNEAVLPEKFAQMNEMLKKTTFLP